MRIKNLQKYILSLFFSLLLPLAIYAQNTTIVTGTVTDEKTREPLPFVSVALQSKKPVGETTDFDGKFTISADATAQTMIVALLGYEQITIKIKPGVKQNINVKLKPQAQSLNAAEVKAKRVRYTNKNNPSVDLVRKVIENKDKNRMESRNYYEYNKYEKLELGLNNFIVDSIQNKTLYKKANVIFNYLEDSDITGQKVLPVFFRETSSVNYYRKSPEAAKEIVHGTRMIDLHQFIDLQSVDGYITNFFGEINIYDSEITLFNNRYMSPLSPFAPNYYRFHIMDTVVIQQDSCIHLEFFPRNEGDFGFRGAIYILNDSTYALKKVELKVAPNANLNFIRNFIFTQEYVKNDDTWCIDSDDSYLEFVYAASDKRSILAHRTVSYQDYKFDQPAQPASIYRGLEKSVKLPDYDNRPPDYWATLRHAPLTNHEEGIFTMVDSLKHVSVFKNALNLVTLIFTGYTEMGKFDMGPVVSFFSFNSLEGPRLRFGGKTNGNFNNHLFLAAYGAYGFKDEKFKYNGTVMYSIDKKKQNPWEFPMNLLQVSYDYDVKTPGQSFLYGSSDKLFLSFIRGSINNITYERKFELSWTKEHTNGISLKPSFRWVETDPERSMTFTRNTGEVVDKFVTSEVGMDLRFAPNEKFFQSQMNRFPLDQADPIISLHYRGGFDGFLGGKYTYHKTDATFYKRSWIGGFGYADSWIKAGKIWNKVPYPMLTTPQANQSWAYQDEAYNMMNYLEFVSDQYISANISYGFNGFLANRIPLLRKLKLREFLTFKAFWGTLSEKNDPTHPNNVNDPRLFQLPMHEGAPSTFRMDGKNPYMEVSVAIDNIFKILRIDLIKRINYLDNPNIPVWSIRFRLRPSF